ncbi:MAG: hypothetical protein ACOZNI_33695 [Myxococcota bacterium]
MSGIRNLIVAAGLLAPASALAGDWDWTEEFSSRHWRTSTLQWAQDIRPDHPSFAYLQANYPPPAHEMWCHSLQQPTSQDFAIHTQKLNDWLHAYLNVPAQDPLPPLPPHPPECVR